MLKVYNLPLYNCYPGFLKRFLAKPLKREVRFLYQRLIRGWDDSETWSLDYSLAKHILLRLKRFRDITTATPYNMEDKDWRDQLDKMIATFEFVASGEYWGATPEDYAKHQEGLNLFAKHYFSLWY